MTCDLESIAEEIRTWANEHGCSFEDAMQAAQNIASMLPETPEKARHVLSVLRQVVTRTK